MSGMTHNILLCYYSIGGTSYYEDFAEEFINNGHNILHWNLFLTEGFNKKEIIKDIIDFNPSLVFSYNNNFPEELIKILKAKIFILDADNPEFFENKNIINKYDFFYLGYQSNSQDLYKNFLKANITDQNYLSFFTATNFKKDPEIFQNINISFIGSNFYNDFLHGKALSSEQIDLMLSLSKKIKNNYYYQDNSIDYKIINYTKWYFAGQQRLNYLSVLSDLGLQIYSNSNWKDMFLRDFELINCYNPRKIITKEDNQNIYNSSKISINLSHPQATNSFAWRVTDIMASNSCLVMEDKPDWHQLFGSIISKEVKDAIIYKDRYDMRQKCITLLNDETLRMRCVKECQDSIEKNGRWRHRIKDLQNKTGINLIREKIVSDRRGSIFNIVLNSKLDAESLDKNLNSINKKSDIEKKIDFINLKKEKKYNRSDLYVLVRIFLILIYFLPFIGPKIVKKKKLNKLLNTIQKKIE